MKKLVVLSLVLFGCGVVAKPPQPYFGSAKPAQVVKASASGFGCSRVLCSTSVSVTVRVFNDKPHHRNVTVECQYEVSSNSFSHHTRYTYKVFADTSRVLIIPYMLTIEKPQYGTGYVRCRAHFVEGVGSWSGLKAFEVAQRYR